MTRLIPILLLLGACSNTPDRLDWMRAPHDAEVRVYAFEGCLSRAKGPTTTQYNDWDEAIDSCDSYAEHVSRYCPPRTLCEPDLPPLADIRKVLPPPPAQEPR